MASGRAQRFGKLKARGLIEFGAGIMGREFVGFIEDSKVPSGRTEFFLQFLVAGNLVETNNQLMVALEWVGVGRRLFQRGRVDAELQAKFLKKFVAPLFDEAAGGDDQNAARVGPHNQLADVKPGHDGLACTWVVRKDEPERLAR